MANQSKLSEPSSLGSLIDATTAGRFTSLVSTAKSSASDALVSVLPCLNQKGDLRHSPEPETTAESNLEATELSTESEEELLRAAQRRHEEALAAQELREREIVERCISVADDNPDFTILQIARQVSHEFGVSVTKMFSVAAEALPHRHLQDRQRRDEMQAARASEEERVKESSRLVELDEWWSRTVGKYSKCRMETFVLHGSPDEQKAQSRVHAELSALDLSAAIKSGQNIVFIGPPGTGKDHLMHSLAYKMLPRLGHGIKAFNGSAVRAELHRLTFVAADKGASFINELNNCKLLMLSDPAPTGGRELSDFQAESLYHIVDHRGTHGLPVWATLNLPLKETREAGIAALTAPVYDRLIDNAIVMFCSWGSMRKPDRLIR